MKIIKKIAAAAAAASLVLSLSACGRDVSWAAKIGKEETVPIGLYIYNQAVTYRNAVQSDKLTNLTDLSKQTVEVSGSDTKATDYIDSSALKNVKSCVGARLLAKQMNIELTPEEISDAEENAKSAYETDKEVFEQNGVALSSVEEYYKDTALKSKLFTAKYGKDGTEPVTDEELKAYINENFATICYIQQYFYNDDGSMMSEAETEKVKKQYESIKSQAEKGKIKFVDKCKEFEKNATSYKSGSTSYTTYWSSDYEEARNVLALKEGELMFLNSESAIVLLQKIKIDYSAAGLKSSRESLLLSYKYEDFVDELVALAESDKSVSFNDAAFKRFGSSTRDFSSLSIPTNSYY